MYFVDRKSAIRFHLFICGFYLSQRKRWDIVLKCATVASISFPIYYSLASPYSTLYNPEIEKASLKGFKRDINKSEGKKRVNNQPNNQPPPTKKNILAPYLGKKAAEEMSYSNHSIKISYSMNQSINTNSK